MSASQYKKLLISWLFFTHDIASTWLYWSSPSNNAAGWWVPEVRLSVQENLRKIQKWMLERRFEHKTSLSETWEKRCLATAPTKWLFINVTSYSLIYFHLPIPSVKHRCCWWVPWVSLSIQENLRYLDYFYPWYCRLLAFFPIPSVKQRIRMWFPEVSLSVQ